MVNQCVSSMCLKPSFWNICRDLKFESTMPAVMSLFCSASLFDMSLTIKLPKPRLWKRSSTCSDPNEPISILKHHAISSSSSLVNTPRFKFISINLWMKYSDPLCLCGQTSLIFSPFSGTNCFKYTPSGYLFIEIFKNSLVTSKSIAIVCLSGLLR